MLLKSAYPTPTIIILKGREEAPTILSTVASKSVIIPSVMIKQIEYF